MRAVRAVREMEDVGDLRHPVTNSSAAKRLHTIDYGARIAAPTTFDEFDDADFRIISGTMPAGVPYRGSGPFAAGGLDPRLVAGLTSIPPGRTGGG
jgi:hypothetical protein